jgi:hypothetical protein
MDRKESVLIRVIGLHRTNLDKLLEHPQLDRLDHTKTNAVLLLFVGGHCPKARTCVHKVFKVKDGIITDNITILNDK